MQLSLKHTSLLACVLTSPLLVAQKVHSTPPKNAVSSNATPARSWLFHESKDPMTDKVNRTLFLYGTPVTTSSTLDTEPYLFLTCNAGQPRKVVINMGVFLDDAHPTFRLDQEPATQQHWFTPSSVSASYYKDDSIAPAKPYRPQPSTSEVSKAQSQAEAEAAQARRQAAALSGTPEEEFLSNPASGADAFVKSLAGHHTLLVKANPRDGAPKIVSFDLTGLQALLTQHCPTQ